MNNQELIKRFCQSKLQYEVHIPAIRSKLYISSSKVFQKLHEGSPKNKELSTFAQQYSTVIKEQIQHVEQFYGPKAAEERAVYQQLQRLWNLCQILYFPEKKKFTSEQLMDWYNQMYKSHLLEFDQQTIFFSTSTFQREDFWPYAIRLALFGQLDQLSALFSHVLLDVSFNLLYDLLGFVKELHTLTGKGVDWLRAHHEYIRQVKQKLRQIQNCPQHTKSMADILSILMGDELVTLQHAKDQIHAFISCTFYKEPSNAPIHEIATSFFTIYGSKMHKIDEEAQLMCHFLAGNIYEALELCAGYDWWFIAHLADLLSIQKVLDRSLYYTVEDGSTLSMSAREYFILTYASYLNNQFELWEESFSYLMTCGSIGKEAVIEHLSAMDFSNNDRKLHDVVKFCINYSMKNNGLVLYEKKATICLKLKDYNNALQYYSQAEKYQQLDQVFEAILKDYVYTGQLYDMNIITYNNLNNFTGIHYIICRDLSQLNTSFLEGDFQSASTTFKKLITTENIPNSLLPVIFGEGWKLLDKKIYFTVGDLLELKNLWIKLKDKVVPTDFAWYHHYRNSEAADKTMEKEKVPRDRLQYDMHDFLNTTAVIIARAFDHQQKNH